MFATATGFNWHPFGLLDFGAEIKGAFVVTANGNYTFSLDSDDGSRLYINGFLVVNNGYSGFNPSGGGAPYSGLIGSFNASAVTFASDFSYGWHPFGLLDFGADIIGALAVPADQVEIAKGPSLSNSQHPPAGGPNSAVIFLEGGARMYSVDSAGNVSPITKVL